MEASLSWYQKFLDNNNYKLFFVPGACISLEKVLHTSAYAKGNCQGSGILEQYSDPQCTQLALTYQGCQLVQGTPNSVQVSCIGQAPSSISIPPSSQGSYVVASFLAVILLLFAL